MNRLPRFLSTLALLWLCLAPVARADNDTDTDTDGDGIWDVHELTLGTDPAFGENFVSVIEDEPASESARRDAQYDPTKDLVSIDFCHVGDDRYLWRCRLAARPRLDDTVLHLYVDADANEATGRKVRPGAPNHGTEYMLSVVGGQGRSTHYDADGNSRSGPPVTFVVQGDTLIVSADVDLGRDADTVRCDLYVLCHTMGDATPRMSDSSRKVPISGAPISGRSKIMRPSDYGESFGVHATFGIDAISAVLARKETIVVPHDQLKLKGFSIDLFTTRRWPHVRRDESQGSVATQAPQPGRYHVGFMMYDDANDERVAMYVDKHFLGVAVARQDNNRTWMYWLAEPINFQGGESVELRAVGGGGKHGICNVLFLPQPPEQRAVEYRVQNMVSAGNPDRPGSVTISWTTTWPCPTRLRYGTDGALERWYESDDACLVHRAVLDALDSNRTYRARAVGQTRDGVSFDGEEFTFRATAPSPPETVAGMHEIPLQVTGLPSSGVGGWPVTAGIPLPQGQLASADAVRLVAGSREIPVQVQATARWPDGSVKWLLVTFLADVPDSDAWHDLEANRENTMPIAGLHSPYRLQYGRGVQRMSAEQPIVVRESKAGVTIATGLLAFTIDDHGNLVDFERDGRALLDAHAACETRAIDVAGAEFRTSGPAEISIEEHGPERVVVRTVSPLVAADGAKLMRIEKRIEAYRGSALVRIHHTFVIDGSEQFTELAQLAYHIPASMPRDSEVDGVAKVALSDGSSLTTPVCGCSIRQLFDNQFVVHNGETDASRDGRVLGTISIPGVRGFAVAVRDFWQNYPKGFRLAEDGLSVDLCPDFPEGTYDGFPFEREGHQLYYYLQNGRYRFKRGMAKTHELILCFDPRPQRSAIATMVTRRPLATAPPRWYADSKVFYEVAPRDEDRFALYEQAIDKNLAQYVQRRERQRDYGLMNYGDWYGERGSNWGNIEYDTQHAFFLEYIRSGNPAAFFLGEAAELHNRDIDTVQWDDDPRRVGAVYIHQMCHVGDYFDHGVPGTLGFPSGGFTVSHAWVEGHFDHYFLTGDRRSYETGRAVADFFVRKQLGRPYDFSTCRTPGWHLIMLAAAYAATNDPYYLNAARVVVRRVLDAQETTPRPLADNQTAGRKPYQVGGWSRMMVPGHCHCEPRHRGNAGFMVAILLSGLKYYHDVTQDPRVKEAMIRGAHYLLDETYSDEVHGFRYTSCPKTAYRAGASPLMAEGVARVYLWTGDDRFRRVLTEALPAAAGGSGYGKGFSMYYRIAPRLLADLDAAGLTLAVPPEDRP